MALAEYAQRSGESAALDAATRAARWLTNKISSSGSIQGYGSTEAAVDVWWAMAATRRFTEAERIKSYLLDASRVWDADLRYWWRGHNDPLIAMDCATWLSAFARHPLVNQPERGMAALSLVRRTLVAVSDDGSLCGFDGTGPVSIWNEGTAQFVAAGGEDGPLFFDMLLSQQNADGSMRGSPDNWTTDAFGWLVKWRGIAPTAWLYFAVKGLPFPSATPPKLTATLAGTGFTITWPASGLDFTLYSASNLTPPVAWFAVTNAICLSNSINSISVDATGRSAFFRLQRP